MTYRDRRGRPVTNEEFDALSSDPHYRQLAAHKVYSMSRPDQVAWVSTVWRGHDDVAAAACPDRIFETELFSETVPDIDGEGQWYETEPRAMEGHQDAVTWLCEQFECPAVEDAMPQDTLALRTDDVIAAIDTALGCQQCGEDLGTSPSDDFCREICQQDWHRARAQTIVDGTQDLRFRNLVPRGSGPRRPEHAEWGDWVVHVEQDLNRRLLYAACTTPLDRLYFTFETQEL